MKIVAVGLLIGLMFIGLAGAGDARVIEPAPLTLEHGQFACNQRGLCVVRADDLTATSHALVEAINLAQKQHAEMERLRAQNRTLSEMKGCAKVEVVPKNKAGVTI